MAKSTTSTSKSGFPWQWIACLAVIVALVVAAKKFHAQDLLGPALDWISDLGPWGPGCFIAIYVVATVLFVPGSVLTLGAGALFGVVQGTIIVSIASTLGATGGFLVGRYLARGVVQKRIEENKKFAAIEKAVAREGWKIVGLIRLSPVIPFTLLNYAFGLTSVSLRHYVLASWIGMIPGTVMYVYLGSLAKAAVGEHARGPIEWTLYGVGLLATIAVTVLVTHIARKELTRKIN